MHKRSAYHFTDSDGEYETGVEVGHPAAIDDADDPQIDLTVTKGTRRIALRLHLTTALSVAEAIKKLEQEVGERIKKPQALDRAAD